MRRVLTVLFTDVVGSTEHAAELADRRWRALLARHHNVVRRELRRFRGREVDTAGDGFLAVFEEPAAGIRCAWAITEAVRQLGLEVRAGLHAGEVEVTDRRIGGIAVHTAARIMSLAGPGEVLVSRTLRELAAGSGALFEDRGERGLKGVPGTWRLFAVTRVDGRSPSAPVSADVAAKRRRQASEPPPRRRRVALALVPAAIAIATAGIVLLAVLGREEPTPRAAETAGGMLLEFDPEAQRVVLRVRLTEPRPLSAPADVAVGEGAVWVIRSSREPGVLLSDQGTSLARLDPDTGAVIETTPLLERPGTLRVVVGERAVWVLSRGIAPVVGGPSIVTQVNPATGEILESAEHTYRELPAGLAVGEGGVWVLTLQGTLVHVDPVDNVQQGRSRVATSGGAVAAGGGAVWVVDDLQDELIRIDPGTGRAVKSIPLPGTPESMAVGEGAVWVLDETNGTVAPVDVNTNEVGEVIAIGRTPSDLVVAFEAVWVISGEESAIWRIDPLTGRPEEIPLPGYSPGAIASDQERGTLWIWSERAPEVPQPL